MTGNSDEAHDRKRHGHIMCRLMMPYTLAILLDTWSEGNHRSYNEPVIYVPTHMIVIKI